MPVVLSKDHDTEGVVFTLGFGFQSYFFWLINSMIKIETASMFIIKTMAFTLP